MRQFVTRLGLLGLVLPLLGIGSNVATITARAADPERCIAVQGQPGCWSDTFAPISGHITFKMPVTGVTPCNLALGAAPPGQLCDFTIDAGATCKSASDPGEIDPTKSCTVSGSGQITAQTACGFGTATLKARIDENPAGDSPDYVSTDWTLAVTGGQSWTTPIGALPVKEYEGGANYNATVAAGTIALIPTGAVAGAVCATGLNFVAHATVMEPAGSL